MPNTKTHKKKEFLKNNKEKKVTQRLIKKITSADFLLFCGTLFVVFVVYSFSLGREWQSFDERLFHKETLFPIPYYFDEISEIIKSFVLNCHTESMNIFFSNHINIRSNPIAFMLIVFVSYFLKKSAFLYHLLQLSIHLTNTALVWLILKQVTEIINLKFNETIKYSLISLFCLLWALHSGSTEAVLLVTNWDTIFTYTFCFAFIYFELRTISNKKYEISDLKTILISVLFCLTMFFTEYAYTLPAIIFFISFAFIYKEVGNFKKSFSISINFAKPYFIGLFLFAFLSLFKPDSTLLSLFPNNSTDPVFQNYSSFYMFLERNLWLVPQIFVNLLKILIFPKILTTYQSTNIPLANTLFEPYSILCFLIYFSFLIIPAILFIYLKDQNKKYSLLLSYSFYFSLFPFLHVLLPTYCLAADRYCYFPSFFLVLLIYCSIFSLFNFSSQKQLKTFIIVTSCILFLLTIRTLIRIQEWSNSYTLYKSALRIENNPLYRSNKLIIFADYVGAQGKQEEMENALQASLKNSLRALKEYKIARKKSPVQPVTLKYYGLDYDSLILKAVYLIATVKNDNYQEPPDKTLAFYESSIKKRLATAGINQILLYADILQKAGRVQDAKEMLEYALKRFPYSSSVLFSLTDYYFMVENNLEKTWEILEKAYKYYPNDKLTIEKLIKYYDRKNDLPNKAKYSYLLGLRMHSPKSYQNAALIYLDIGQINPAYKTLKKLARLSSTDPLTLLLTSRYLDMAGKRDKILDILNSAYRISKSQGKNQDINVYKNIILSIINITAHKGDLDTARKFIKEFEDIKTLNAEDRKQLSLIKSDLKL